MSQTKWSFAVACCLLFSIGTLARNPLTFEERVKAQEAIERVTYAHRIWPRENPQPKPPFEQMVPKAQIEAKVTDTLKKCSALDKYWQRPITGEQLQAEMDRMAKGTKDPATLKELFAALKDDPTLIAECLARPVLADRLIHNWYGSDTRFHTGAREKAECAMKEAAPENLSAWPEGEYHKVTYELKSDQESEEEKPSGQNEISLDKGEFQQAREKAPEAGRLTFQETLEAFVIERTVHISDEALVLQSLTFAKHPFSAWWEEVSSALSIAESASKDASYALPDLKSAPSPEAEADTWTASSLCIQLLPESRYRHTAVWTGTEMIIWGGFGRYPTYTYKNDGGRYNPSTDTWVTMSTGTNCPTARQYHTAVWTGTEMIVWGGYGSSPTYKNDGGRYNPSTDTWTATSTAANCPTERGYHKAVWTGAEMIVWGGSNGSTSFNTGGRYNPSTDTWVATSIGTNCPPARSYHTAVWTGTEMIVWGGYTLNTGGRYNPSTDTWVATSTGANCPSARSNHTAVWTGTEMIVWGGTSPGFNSTGGRYNPSSDTWAATSTGTNCPSARYQHTAIWTGTEMIVWGGHFTDTSEHYYYTGGRYSPSTDTWTATSTGSTLSGRADHTAVWTETEMIVWGGYDDSTPHENNNGSRYYPSTDTWAATSMGTGPSAYNHTAIWTGTEMIVWGGGPLGTASNTGGRYYPSTDTWTTTSTGTNCPSARVNHTAVWTGWQMIIWGGNWGGAIIAGGLYNPSTDAWMATSTGTNCAEARFMHTAVWTGTEMIVWGGWNSGGVSLINTGGRYNPSTDAWAATSTGTNCPSARYWHTAVSTGAKMIIWGGYGSSPTYKNDGGLYYPSTDTWEATSTGTNCPSARAYHTAVWTGTEMIVWGGSGGSTLNTGGLYNPSADTWLAPTTGTNCPSARYRHTSIWTGTEMIVWGGYNGSYLNTGGGYSPSSDTWAATSTGTNCPSGRREHTAVWTGTQMIIWGGEYRYSESTKTGGLYNPYACTIPLAPGAPTFTGVVCTSLTVNWAAVANATTYDVWRVAGASCAGAVKITTTPVAGLTYNDTGLTPGTQYSYYLVAMNACGASPDGACASGTTLTACAPEEISSGATPATAQAWAPDKTTMSWTSDATATGYRLYRGIPADLPNLVTSTVDSCTRYDGVDTTFNLNGTNDQPPSGTFLWFLVTAYNGIGEGSAGNASAVPRIVNSPGVCP